MAETLKIPLVGTHVTPEGDGSPGSVPQPTQPAAQPVQQPLEHPVAHRPSLHKLKGLGQQIVKQVEMEHTPYWHEGPNGHGSFKFNSRPVEPPQPEPAPIDPLHQRLDALTGTLERLTQPQPDAGPQQPNPAAFDFYDPQEEAEYHRMNNEWIEHTKQQALAPHRAAIADAEITRQYLELADRYGHEAGAMAVQVALEAGGKLSLAEAFEQVTNPDAARPGRRSVHLPRQINNVKSLGAMMAHNQITGRARGR